MPPPMLEQGVWSGHGQGRCLGLTYKLKSLRLYLYLHVQQQPRIKSKNVDTCHPCIVTTFVVKMCDNSLLFQWLLSAVVSIMCYQLELRKYLADLLTECCSHDQGERERSANKQCYL